MNRMENVYEVAIALNNTYEDMYNICYPLVEEIINEKVTDTEEKKKVLNLILGIYTEKGFNLYLKLLFYYSEIAMEKSYTYLDRLKESRKEEYDDYVKKLEKRK